MTDKEQFDAFLEVASHCALRAAAAAARSGRRIAEAVCWPCYDRVVAPAVHPWPGADAVGAAAAAAQALQHQQRKRLRRRRRLSLSEISHDASRDSLNSKFKLGFDGSY